MKKIKVVCVYPKFYFDGSFGGMAFTIYANGELVRACYVKKKGRSG